MTGTGPGSNTLRTVVAAALLAVLCACASSGMRAERQTWDPVSVPRNKVLVVGKIEMHPPLSEDEQLLKGGRGGELRNAFVLFCGDQQRDLSARLPEDLSGGFDITLEKEFFITVDRDKPLAISGGIFYTAYDPPANVQYRTFSSPLMAMLKPGDEAVYIGTIQFYRDANNRLLSVTIRDDHQWADTRYKERFGTYSSLRKALAMPAPPSQ